MALRYTRDWSQWVFSCSQIWVLMQCCYFRREIFPSVRVSSFWCDHGWKNTEGLSDGVFPLSIRNSESFRFLTFLISWFVPSREEVKDQRLWSLAVDELPASTTYSSDSRMPSLSDSRLLRATGTWNNPSLTGRCTFHRRHAVCCFEARMQKIRLSHT